MPLVTRATDRKLLPFDFETRARGGRFHHLHRFGHHFQPDVVAQQDSDSQHAAIMAMFDAQRRNEMTTIKLAAFAAVAALSAMPIAAQTYPVKPVRLIVPFP